jgi:hypothetical protein
MEIYSLNLAQDERCISIKCLPPKRKAYKVAVMGEVADTNEQNRTEIELAASRHNCGFGRRSLSLIPVFPGA